jgi:glycosyltransferase involved in cell wall biosynthesis
MKQEVEQLHLTESLIRLGGVETLVRQLIASSPRNHAAALLDAPMTGIERGVGLRASKLAGAFLIQRSARAHFPRVRHLIFHNFAGMMMLSGAIPHERRSLFLHTNSPDVFALLPARLPYLDTIMVSGRDLADELHAKFPHLDVPVTPVEYPLDERYFEAVKLISGDRLVLGYSGRLEVEQKQVFRLVELCRHLEACGINFTLEIAGSGSAMEQLRRSLPGHCCRFLGPLDPVGLHAAYKRWRFLICTSDYETGPLVALEAMAAGVIPILPDIRCQATALLADLDLPLYPCGQMAAAAAVVRKLVAAPCLGRLVAQLRDKVEDRRIDGFVARVDTLLSVAADRPALGAIPPLHRGISELLPLSLRRSGNSHLR